MAWKQAGLSETEPRAEERNQDAFSFLREAKQSDYTGGAEHAGKSNLSLHRVQTAQLQHHEEQEKRS